jgi:histidine kinase
VKRLLRRLDARLFASHAIVAVIGALAATLVARRLAPGLFDDRMGQGGRFGQGPPAGSGEARGAMQDALDAALAAGLVVAVAAAALAAVLVTRRLLRSLDSVRGATRDLAGGRYAVRVPIPPETELAALAADVNRLGEALASTEQRRARLISDLAHELRTPLTTIEGFLEGLIDGVFEPTPEVLGDLSDEVGRLKRLAGDLGTLSRADEGALRLELTRTDVAELARRVTDRLRPQFEDKGVTLDVHAGAPSTADVDADRIVQLLTNLVGNALAYTPAGGTVTVTTATDPDGVTVTVRDTGIGIPPGDLELVFERFQRGDRTGRGTGIGLTIARSIARAHGGEVTARSAGPGRGATFTVRLPAV